MPSVDDREVIPVATVSSPARPPLAEALDHLDDLRTTVVDPALEVGRYDLELTLDGYLELAVPIVIEAGRTLEMLDLVIVALKRPGTKGRCRASSEPAPLSTTAA